MTEEEFCEKWREGILEEVHSDADTSYRHGCYMNDVFKDLDTGKLWQVGYAVSGDGEQNGIRDGELFGPPIEVFPHKVESIAYLTTPKVQE